MNAPAPNQLVRYEAARNALAAARQVDEVKGILNEAAAREAYARQANDTEMIEWATEIKVRAERRLGDLVIQQKATVGLNKGTAGRGNANVGRGTGGSKSAPPVDRKPKLADAGISKKLSARAQQLSRMPEEKFEAALAATKATVGRVSTSLVLSQAKEQKTRASREADENTPVVIKPGRTKTEWDKAQDVMASVERLGAGAISAERVWSAIDWWQHKNITNNLDSAIEFLKSLKGCKPNVSKRRN